MEGIDKDNKNDRELEILVKKLKNDLNRLSQLTGLTEDHILDNFKVEKQGFPISIFTSRLGILETVVKYCREDLGMKYEDIALLLKRKKGPIGVTYRSAKKKFPHELDTSSGIKIPFSIFSQSLTAFENIVLYMKNLGYQFSQIAFFLKRDQRTIWTTYKRARGKNG